jgi:hypothetical protein
MIYVENIKTHNYEWKVERVYVGRRNSSYNLKASPLHNQFKVGLDGTRDEVIKRFDDALRSNLQPSAAYGGTVRKEMDRLTELAKNGDLVLLCWCAPEPCHADIIARVIRERLGTEYLVDGEDYHTDE